MSSDLSLCLCTNSLTDAGRAAQTLTRAARCLPLWILFFFSCPHQQHKSRTTASADLSFISPSSLCNTLHISPQQQRQVCCFAWTQHRRGLRLEVGTCTRRPQTRGAVHPILRIAAALTHKLPHPALPLILMLPERLKHTSNPPEMRGAVTHVTAASRNCKHSFAPLANPKGIQAFFLLLFPFICLFFRFTCPMSRLLSLRSLPYTHSCGREVTCRRFTSKNSEREIVRCSRERDLATSFPLLFCWMFASFRRVNREWLLGQACLSTA
jgi:hypothetical protein